jgi:hypothetical protein
MAAEEDDLEKSSDSSEAKGTAAPKRARQPVTIDLEATVVDQRASDGGSMGEASEDRARKDAASAEEPAASTSSTSPGAEAVPSAAPRNGGNWVGYFAAGLVGGLIVVLIGYGLFASGVLTGPDRTVAERAAADAKSAEASAAALDERLAKLESATAANQDSARISKLSDGLTAVDTAAKDLRTEVGSLSTTLGDLEARVTALGKGPTAAALDDLNKRIDALGESGATGEVLPAALIERVTKLENSLAVLSGRVDAVTDRIEALAEKPAAAKDGARAIAVGALTQAARRGGTFAGELAMLATLTPDDPDVAALQPLAERGAPSRDELAGEFPAVADAILAATAEAEPGTGFWQRLLHSARGLVTIRPAGPIAGDTPQAIVSRMEEAVKRGDFPAMLSERDRLSEAGKAASDDFAKAAADRVAIDGFVDKLAHRDVAPADTQ